MLTNFSGAALIMQFQKGINTNLGRDVIKYKAPGDNDIDAWYAGALALGKAHREADKVFGGKNTWTNFRNNTSSLQTQNKPHTFQQQQMQPWASTSTMLPPGEPMDID